MLLNNGFNYFDEQGTLPIIEGTMQVAPPDGGFPMLLANSNRWNVANNVPAISDFDVTSSIIDGLVINFATASPTDGACPAPNGDIFSETGFAVPSYQDGQANLNTLNFNNVSLSNALNTCMETTNRYDNTKTDVAALALFEEVLVEYPTFESSRVNEILVRTGASLMKQTLQHAFETDEITIADNNTQFHAGVQSYVNVLNALTSVPYNSYNYEQMFYLEMDKAHLYRMIGKTDLALMILLNAEGCDLDFEEQEHLNFWKYEWDEEIRMVDYGFDSTVFKDTVWVDTTLYKTPIQQPFGEFGSQIIDVNNITFFNCGQSRFQISDDSQNDYRSLKVYPNPNKGVFQIEYDLPEESEGIIIIHNVEGKEVYRFICSTGQHTKTVDLSSFRVGTYLYTYYVDGKSSKTGKVIVK